MNPVDHEGVQRNMVVIVILPTVLDGVIEHPNFLVTTLDWVIKRNVNGLAMVLVFIENCLDPIQDGNVSVVLFF